VDIVTATPTVCVLFAADDLAIKLAFGPFLAAKVTALALTATELSDGKLTFMVFSKTTAYKAS
jgi:hypothetical protein